MCTSHISLCYYFFLNGKQNEVYYFWLLSIQKLFTAIAYNERFSDILTLIGIMDER